VSEASGPGRRRWLMAGVAVAAGATGAWVATRRQAEPGPSTVKPGAADPVEAFWQLSFDTPVGGSLAMASLKGKPLLVNFWATWCAPCVREMPEIDRFYRDHAGKGWQVVGLAIDGPTPVREFLSRVPVGFLIGLAGLEGTELVRQLGNDRGGLPFSLAFDRQGQVAHRKLGETSYDELAGWARSLG
jgi:thiol-disulfide isomerase/thioredoxin